MDKVLYLKWKLIMQTKLLFQVDSIGQTISEIDWTILNWMKTF